MNAPSLQIYFLNNGSAVLQTPDYCHAYDDMDQLAEDYWSYCDSGSTAGWDGNEPECRMSYDSDVAASGGYVMYDQDDIDSIEADGWRNIREFAASLAGEA